MFSPVSSRSKRISLTESNGKDNDFFKLYTFLFFVYPFGSKLIDESPTQ